REGELRAGINFTLIKGTLVRGRVTDGPAHRPAARALVQLEEEGPPLRGPTYHQSGSKTERLRRFTYTDLEGNYQFRVGPGRYRLVTSDRNESTAIDVRDQAEILCSELLYSK